MYPIIRYGPREKVVDYTHYIYIDQVVFASQSPSMKKQDLSFSNRISKFVWLCSFMSFLVIFNLLYYFIKTSETTFGQFSNESIVVKMFGILLQQCKNF